MTTDPFMWLSSWYEARTNGDWEHGFGVMIQTLDNPGWSITINLNETKLSDAVFSPVRTERSERDWVRCWVENSNFKAACGPLNLVEALDIFRAWWESVEVK